MSGIGEAENLWKPMTKEDIAGEATTVKRDPNFSLQWKELSRRDLFVGLAMNGMMSNPNVKINWDELREAAIKAADEMIERLDRKD